MDARNNNGRIPAVYVQDMLVSGTTQHFEWVWTIITVDMALRERTVPAGLLEL